MTHVPPIAFLGIAERAAYVQDGASNLRKHNIIGLKQIVASHIYPLGLGGFCVALGFYSPAVGAKYRLRLIHDSGLVAGDVELTLSASEAPIGQSTRVDVDEGTPTLRAPEAGWLFATTQAGLANIMIHQPGLYRVFLVTDGSEDVPLGQLYFLLVEPEPLSVERIAAIRSNPSAAKAVRIHIACKKCGSAIRCYAALERSGVQEDDGWLWYEDLSDRFDCSCGNVKTSLSIIRRNLHGLLGSSLGTDGQVAFMPMYEEGAMQTLRTTFSALLAESAPEETFQKFIETNPLLLHSFSPQRLFVKPPILTGYKCDFAIVTPQNELLLIELERPNTKILKKDGGVHSELQHAFDQVRDWLHMADEHRVAVLECLGLASKSIGAVNAVVIAGTDKGKNLDHLRKLKGHDFGRVRFLTYDDLLSGLDSLLAAVRRL